MKVCGACGLRNPDEQYKRSRPLTGLPSEHWLVVNPELSDV